MDKKQLTEVAKDVVAITLMNVEKTIKYKIDIGDCPGSSKDELQRAVSALVKKIEEKML